MAEGTQRRLAAIIAVVLMIGLMPIAAGATDAEKCNVVLEDPSSLIRFDTFSPKGARGPVQGVLRRPAGDGPFPAVVILHRYFGIEPPDCFAEDQKRFAARGWISLVVDSNSAPPELRSGRPDTRSGYSFQDQAVDAWGAKIYLALRDDVATDKIVALGHAYGATALLRAVSTRRMAPRFKVAAEIVGPPFAAAVAWNPGCMTDLQGLQSPLLIVIGEDDRQTPAYACRRMAVTGPAAHAFRLIVFPDIGHNFDATWLPTYNRSATEQAYSETFRFLNRVFGQ